MTYKEFITPILRSTKLCNITHVKQFERRQYEYTHFSITSLMPHMKEARKELWVSREHEWLLQCIFHILYAPLTDQDLVNYLYMIRPFYRWLYDLGLTAYDRSIENVEPMQVKAFVVRKVDREKTVKDRIERYLGGLEGLTVLGLHKEVLAVLCNPEFTMSLTDLSSPIVIDPKHKDFNRLKDFNRVLVVGGDVDVKEL